MGLTHQQQLIQGLNRLGFRKHLVGGEQQLDCGHYKNGLWYMYVNKDVGSEDRHTLMWEIGSDPTGRRITIATFAVGYAASQIIDAIEALTK